MFPGVKSTARTASSKKTKKAVKKKTVKKTATAVKRTCKTVTRKVHGKKRKVRVCTPVKKRPAALSKPATTPAVKKPAASVKPAPVVAPKPPVTAPEVAVAPAYVAVPTFTKPVSEAHIERLLWRAGFGPRPGQAAALAGGDLQSAVFALTRPAGAAQLTGPEPVDDNGHPLTPADAWGHDHCWWLDRMVRSDQQLVERMTLIWHDWFATSNDGVGDAGLMLAQNQLFRDKALGSFDDLFAAVTIDPAMLIWLNGTSNNKWNSNENYAREMMELFSLGADRGAYTETDIREMARTLTGWRNDWSNELGAHNFRYDASFHDIKNKTVFGHTGNFDYRDAVRLCVEHPQHASFFCTKLWSYFVPVAPDDATLAALQGVYLAGGRQIRPVVEAILQHPAFIDGPPMVVPPIVYTAGLLRAVGRPIDTTAWSWLAPYGGQRLFYPPNVAGWDDSRWLDTSTVRGRWVTAHYVLSKLSIAPYAKPGYDATEDAAQAVARAMAALGNPTISVQTQQVIAEYANSCLPPMLGWQQAPYRAMRQNALRMLIATCPDFHVS